LLKAAVAGYPGALGAVEREIIKREPAANGQLRITLG
jgi:hypothetical protein